MRKRSLAREFALQILYQIDITRDSLETVAAAFWQSQDEPQEEAVKTFCVSLVEGVLANLEAIDKQISQYATNWQLKRMAVVDRNVLR